MTLQQQLVIITGASRGLGAALAAASLAAGVTVLGLARHAIPTDVASAAQGAACLLQWQADLADAAPAAARLRQWLGGLSPDSFATATLINNAGILPFIAPLRDAAPDEIARGVRVNLEAPLLLTAAFLAGTRGWRGARRVLNISSGLARHPMASQSGYCATKAGLDMATRCLALEEGAAASGVRVCALAPGVVDTAMQIELRGADADRFPDRGRFEQLKAGGRLVGAADAAHRILAYLESPAFGAEPIADIREITAD